MLTSFIQFSEYETGIAEIYFWVISAAALRTNLVGSHLKIPRDFSSYQRDLPPNIEAVGMPSKSDE